MQSGEAATADSYFQHAHERAYNIIRTYRSTSSGQKALISNIYLPKISIYLSIYDSIDYVKLLHRAKDDFIWLKAASVHLSHFHK